MLTLDQWQWQCSRKDVGPSDILPTFLWHCTSDVNFLQFELGLRRTFVWCTLFGSIISSNPEWEWADLSDTDKNRAYSQDGIGGGSGRGGGGTSNKIIGGGGAPPPIILWLLYISMSYYSWLFLDLFLYLYDTKYINLYNSPSTVQWFPNFFSSWPLGLGLGLGSWST